MTDTNKGWRFLKRTPPTDTLKQPSKYAKKVTNVFRKPCEDQTHPDYIPTVFAHTKLLVSQEQLDKKLITFTNARKQKAKTVTISSQAVILHKKAVINFMDFKHSNGKRFHLEIAKNKNYSICAVAALTNYFTLRNNTTGPLFLNSSVEAVSRQLFQHALNDALNLCGISRAYYNRHSFRIGFATDASAKGLSTETIRTLDEDLHPKPKRRKISYDCPKDGCIKSFSSNETLDNHLLLGDCNYVQVISVHDKAKIMYGTKVNSLFINTQSVSIPSDSVVGESGLRQGWALKTKKKRVIFSDAQRKYMHDRFYAGKRTGSKVDPFRAAEEMRNMKEEDQYLFKRNDYLTGQQISSYFSRLAMKDRNSEPGDFKSAEEEDSKHELKIKILQQISK
ncbi:Hypothetical predicted protein [Mytilus galloprovincialis]|uniref:C2H2-type domain-containing protein n=1 Tax=Mytilus galloprovincialis TaxID=29158 RepID=A0A8B6C3T3_MYTGA|nr:Hypothetical predicted protein [Mytilus galloprovincialis]